MYQYLILLSALVVSVTGCQNQHSQESEQSEVVEQVVIAEQTSEELTFEQGYCELLRLNLLANAVEFDMQLSFAVKDSTTSSIAAPAREAAEQMLLLKEDLLQLPMPAEFTEIQSILAVAIDKDIYIYEVYAEEREDEVNLDSEYEELNGIIVSYNEALTPYRKEFLSTPTGVMMFDSWEYVLSLIENPDEKDLFLEGVGLALEDRNFLEAGMIFDDLLDSYKDTPVEASIIIFLIDCMRMGGDDVKAVLGDEETALGILDEFIMRGEYSPYIYWVYRQWRVYRQQNDHGSSNWSDIPNDEYIEVLWTLVESTQRYISENPDNICAKKELRQLLNMPLIERWGSDCIYGNSILKESFDLWDSIY